jgi:DNA polymerase-4
MSDIIYLNFVEFMAGVAAVLDKELRWRPFVIRGAGGGRAVAVDVSPEAMETRIVPGMTLAPAERKATDLVTVAPNPAAYRNCSSAIEKIASRYAPAFQNDSRGNWYLAITGTAGLFEVPVDCASRVLRGQSPVSAKISSTTVAGNKPTGKIATRTIRPVGLIHIRQRDEAAFLTRQDIRLLPTSRYPGTIVTEPKVRFGALLFLKTPGNGVSPDIGKVR